MLNLRWDRILRISMGAGLGLALAACGGDSNFNAADKPAITPPPKVTLSGVAAIGAPVVGGKVKWKCSSGALGRTTTDAAGAWSGEFLETDFPCITAVSEGTVAGDRMDVQMVSVAVGAGTNNITPITSLATALTVKVATEVLYEGLFESPKDFVDERLWRDLDSKVVNEGIKKVNQILGDLPGMETTVSSDVFSTPFVAIKGDAMDAQLERFSAATQAAGLTFSDLTRHALAGEKPTQEAHTVTAFTTPHLMSFAAGWSKNLDGREVFSIPDPGREKYLADIASRDDEGNITALVSGGPISGVASLLGNRVGSLCVEDRSGIEIKSRNQYLYVASDLTEVEPSELFGRMFRDYADCAPLGSTLINDSGWGIFAAPGEESSVRADFKQAFTSAGLEQVRPSGISVARAKAFKYTSNEKTTYVYVLVSSLKGSNEPRINGETDYAVIGISE